MNGTPKQTFVELTIVESSILNAPSPRKGLVDLALIASLEDLGENTPRKTRCAVTLHEASDEAVANDGGEQVIRSNRTLFVRESYEALAAILAEHAAVVRPK